MAVKTRTIGLSRFARALVHQGRVPDANAERPTSAAKAANSDFVHVMPVYAGIPRIILREGDVIEFAEHAHIVARCEARRTGALKVERVLTALVVATATTNK